MAKYFADELNRCKCGCAIFEKVELYIIYNSNSPQEYKTLYRCTDCGQAYELNGGKFVEYKSNK